MNNNFYNTEYFQRQLEMERELAKQQKLENEIIRYENWVQRYLVKIANGEPLSLSSESIKFFLVYNLSLPVGTYKFVKLDEMPVIWRHSCAATGVLCLKPNIYNMYNCDIQIYYIICHQCKKVIYYLNNVDYDTYWL